MSGHLVVGNHVDAAISFSAIFGFDFSQHGRGDCIVLGFGCTVGWGTLAVVGFDPFFRVACKSFTIVQFTASALWAVSSRSHASGGVSR